MTANPSSDDDRLTPDGVFDDEPLRSVFKGRRGMLNLPGFDKAGDWDTYCRAADLLVRTIKPSAKNMLADAVHAASMICLALTPRGTLGEALDASYGVTTLWGVDIPALMAWCAVCHVRHASYMDCERVMGDGKVGECIRDMFKRFDGLEKTKYNDIRIHAMDMYVNGID